MLMVSYMGENCSFSNGNRQQTILHHRAVVEEAELGHRGSALQLYAVASRAEREHHDLHQVALALKQQYQHQKLNDDDDDVNLTE